MTITSRYIYAWTNLGFSYSDNRRSEIYENKLLFPVFITNPAPVPSTFITPENIIFLATNGFA